MAEKKKLKNESFQKMYEDAVERLIDNHFPDEWPTIKNFHSRLLNPDEVKIIFKTLTIFRNEIRRLKSNIKPEG